MGDYILNYILLLIGNASLQLCLLDPPTPERSFWPWSISAASWHLLLKTILWASCPACSKQWWPYLLPGRKNERESNGFGMQGIERILMTSSSQHQSLPPVANRNSWWVERLKAHLNSPVTVLLVSAVLSGESRKPVDTSIWYLLHHWAWLCVSPRLFSGLNYPNCVVLDSTF